MSIEHCIKSAGRKFHQSEDLALGLRIRHADVNDAEEIVALQDIYGETRGILTISSAVQKLRDNKHSFNIVIEDNEGRIVHYLLSDASYGFRWFKETGRKLRTEKAGTLNDSMFNEKAFCLGNVATHPDFSGKGLYAISEALAELAAGEFGCNLLYIVSVPSAVDSHKAIGAEVTDFYDAEKPEDRRYLMKINLTAERIERARKILAGEK